MQPVRYGNNFTGPQKLNSHRMYWHKIDFFAECRHPRCLTDKELEIMIKWAYTFPGDYTNYWHDFKNLWDHSLERLVWLALQGEH